jgi:hypothetical protein
MTEIKKDALAARNPDEVLRPDAKNLRILATDLFNSTFFTGINNIPQALAVIQLGSELGFPPISSLNMIKPIKGQLTISARGLMALATKKAQVKWEVVESTAERCEIVFHRPGWTDVTSIFTIEEAKRAGLVKVDSGWAKYPIDMLFARAGSRGVRRIAPDSTSGLYSTEEMQDAPINATAEPGKPGKEPEKPGPNPPGDPFPEGDKSAPEPGAGTPQDEPGTQGNLPGAASGSGEGDGGPGTARQADGPHPPGDEDEDDPLRHAETAEGHDEEDREKEFLITTIKEKLTQEKIDEREFKEWLFKLQNSYRPVKAFCGKMGKAMRFHLGKTSDLKYLSSKLDTSILVFKGEKEKKS